MSEPARALDQAIPGEDGPDFDAPIAETLDEQTLRLTFPDAPADLRVPRDVSGMFGARMRRLWANHSVTFVVVVVGFALASFGSLMAGNVVLPLVLVGLLLAGAVGTAWVQHSRAADDFFDRYAAARGLNHVEDGHVTAGVPLCGKGDKRRYPRVLSGRIAGQPAALAHYTYTEVSYDSDGDRQETDYDFTILRFTLPPQVAARFVGVYLSPKSFSFGGLQDRLQHDRAVQLESSEFAKRYSLRVVDSQDDIALYELFSTTFIHRLATELHVYWEQRGSDLVFWHKGHEGEAADLDRFCLEAWHVLHRYLEEWR